MEDIFQYIVITVGVIVIIMSKVRKLNKESSHTNGEKPVLTPAKEVKRDPVSDWEKWFETDERDATTLKQEPVVVVPHSENIHTDYNAKNKLATEKKSTDKIKVPQTEEPSESRSDFQFQSIEEVRKAIIYAEIIQRKY